MGHEGFYRIQFSSNSRQNLATRIKRIEARETLLTEIKFTEHISRWHRFEIRV